MNRIKKFKIKKFFNLIEITLAIGILATGVLAITFLIPNSVKETLTSSSSTYSEEGMSIIQFFLLKNNEIQNLPIIKPDISSLEINFQNPDPSTPSVYPQSQNGVYGIRIQGADGSIEFEGVALAWKSIPDIYIEGKSGSLSSSDKFLGLNLEVLYPLEKGSTDTYVLSNNYKKNYVYTEIYNEN